MPRKIKGGAVASKQNPDDEVNEQRSESEDDDAPVTIKAKAGKAAKGTKGKAEATAPKSKVAETDVNKDQAPSDKPAPTSSKGKPPGIAPSTSDSALKSGAQVAPAVLNDLADKLQAQSLVPTAVAPADEGEVVQSAAVQASSGAKPMDHEGSRPDETQATSIQQRAVGHTYVFDKPKPYSPGEALPANFQPEKRYQYSAPSSTIAGNYGAWTKFATSVAGLLTGAGKPEDNERELDSLVQYVTDMAPGDTVHQKTVAFLTSMPVIATQEAKKWWHGLAKAGVSFTSLDDFCSKYKERFCRQASKPKQALPSKVGTKRKAPADSTDVSHIKGADSEMSHYMPHLTIGELKRRKANGLCYKCNAKWERGHKCAKGQE